MRCFQPLIVCAGLLATTAAVSPSTISIVRPMRVVTSTTKVAPATFVAHNTSDKTVSCAGPRKYIFNATVSPLAADSFGQGLLCGYYLTASGPFPFSGGTITVTASESLSSYGAELSGPCSTGTCVVDLSPAMRFAAIPIYTSAPTLAITARANTAFEVSVVLST